MIVVVTMAVLPELSPGWHRPCALSMCEADIPFHGGQTRRTATKENPGPCLILQTFADGRRIAGISLGHRLQGPLRILVRDDNAFAVHQEGFADVARSKAFTISASVVMSRSPPTTPVHCRRAEAASPR